MLSTIIDFLFISIIDEGVNDGRGINVVVINNITRSIVNVDNFDLSKKGQLL